jgi:opacity protein-like surface antigen
MEGGEMQIGKLLTVAVLSAAVLGARPAAADPPRTAGAPQVGLGFRYGASLEDAEINPWGTGIGLDAGYTLPSAVYLGGVVEYFFGEKVETEFGSAQGNIWQLMAEVGYDVGAGDSFVVRPKAGLGLATVSAETCSDSELFSGCISGSDSYLALAPGATFMLFTSSLSLSLDLRYEMIFGEGDTLDGVIFSLGFGF